MRTLEISLFFQWGFYKENSHMFDSFLVLCDRDRQYLNKFPYEHTTCIQLLDDVEMVVSKLFQRGIHVVSLKGLTSHFYHYSNPHLAN